VQFPVLDAPEGYSGKVVPDWNLAETLLTKVQNDEPYVLGDNSIGRGSREAPADDTTTDQATTDAAADDTAAATDAAAGDQAATDSTADATPADTTTTDETPTDTPVEPEVIEGLVGQTASDVTCAVAN